MSVTNFCSADAQTASAVRAKVTFQTLQEKKQSSRPITALTAYDYATARLVDEAPPVEIYAPAGEGAAIAWLYRHGRVLDREIEDDGGTRLAVRLSDQALGQFEQLFPHAELTHH